MLYQHSITLVLKIRNMHKSIGTAPGQQIKKSQPTGTKFTGFAASTSCQYHSSNAPQSFIHSSITDATM